MTKYAVTVTFFCKKDECIRSEKVAEEAMQWFLWDNATDTIFDELDKPVIACVEELDD